MTHKIITGLAAGFLALTLGSTTWVTPAAANGQFTLSIGARDGRDARALQTGLQLYSLFNSARNGASVRQNGSNNSAGLTQNGRGNLGIVHQEGSGHSGTLQQTGNRNAHGLFQFGRNTSGNVVQSGNRQAGATFQFGW